MTFQRWLNLILLGPVYAAVKSGNKEKEILDVEV